MNEELSVVPDGNGRWESFVRSLASIRTRILALVLIPSIALVATGGTFATLLLREGLNSRDWSNALSVQISPVLEYVTAVQSERTQSLRALAGDQRASIDVGVQRGRTDAQLRNIVEKMAPGLRTLNPEASAKANRALQELLGQMSAVRQSVDGHQASPTEVDEYYAKLAGLVVIAIDDSARTSKDPETAVEEMLSADVMQAADLHSRSVGIASGATVGDGLSVRERSAYAQYASGSQSQLDELAPQLVGVGRARYEKLIASPQWELVSGSNEHLVETGALSVPVSDWVAAQNHIEGQLRAIWSDQYRHAEAVSTAASDRQIKRAYAAGSAVLLIALATLIASMRIASALVRRLRTLRDRTWELADRTLPSMIQRLQDGQEVDIEKELVRTDYGKDELGQVAEAFVTAQRTALGAASSEAQARAGFKRVFLDIARRSQVIVHQQLTVLDTAESKQDNPEHMELLFQLDHLATRARRNAENLLILGGGQPGRKWRQPVALEEVARSAISETRDFARVKAVRLPAVRVLGNVVADLMHLLAELVDNASAFSPPGSPVSVRGNLVGKGVAIEVEDQGLGIRAEERERLNELLSNPPEFQQMASDGHRHLGLFVVGQLARRHGIAVNLTESAYGGVKAIALIPAALLEGVGELESITDTDTTLSAYSITSLGAADGVPAVDVQIPKLLENPQSHSAIGLRPMRLAPPAPLEGPDNRGGRGNRTPLPKRSRQTHLAPQLQIDESASEPDSNRNPIQGRTVRSPQDARSKMASLQSGTRQGRGLGMRARMDMDRTTDE
ncbi:sensor histidine kinase [Nocardia sp. NPDC055029]